MFKKIRTKLYWKFQKYSGVHGYSVYINRGDKFGKFLFDFLNNKVVKKKDYKILEIGSSVGGNLNYLKKLGFKNLKGVDISKKAVNYGKENFKLDLECSDALKFLKKQNTNSYDFCYSVGCLINLYEDYKTASLEMSRVSKDIIMFKEQNLDFSHLNKDLIHKKKQNDNVYLKYYKI